MSEARKATRTAGNGGGRTKRRDLDPVRVFADHRIAYWPSGVPGGDPKQRKFITTCKSAEEAEKRADELREVLRRRRGCGSNALRSFDDLCRDMVEHLKQTAGKPGSYRTYRSNWNCWIPADVGALACVDLELRHWTQIFDELLRDGGTEATVRSVARTLGTAMTFGAHRGYFANREPFACSQLQRSAIVRQAKVEARRMSNLARDVDDAPAEAIGLQECPTDAEVDTYALAFEQLYPRYGYRLVMLAYATGMRVEELLALRVEQVRVEDAEVDVMVQLDRYRHWPATALPKFDRVRTTYIWEWALPIAASLVADARGRSTTEPGVFQDLGYLFPRLRASKVGWANYGSRLGERAAEACDWAWTFHWLRHAFASVSLAPVGSGGYALPIQVVQEALGHARETTTRDIYVHRLKGDRKIVRVQTTRRPQSET